MEGITALQSRVVFWKHVRIPMQKAIFSASGKRKTLVFSVDSLSVDHVPSNIPESSFPAWSVIHF